MIGIVVILSTKIEEKIIICKYLYFFGFHCFIENLVIINIINLKQLNKLLIINININIVYKLFL